MPTNLRDHPLLQLRRPSARKVCYSPLQAHLLPWEESLLLQALTRLETLPQSRLGKKSPRAMMVPKKLLLLSSAALFSLETRRYAQSKGPLKKSEAPFCLLVVLEQRVQIQCALLGTGPFSCALSGGADNPGRGDRAGNPRWKMSPMSPFSSQQRLLHTALVSLVSRSAPLGLTNSR